MTMHGALLWYCRFTYDLRTGLQADGTERWMATTQFEATDARKAFPCWDEPAIKSQFRVTLTVPCDRVAISNMPIVSESAAPEFDGVPHKRVTFDKTPIMSTYILAFVIGDFDFVEAECSSGVAEGAQDPSGNCMLANHYHQCLL
jgi:puromycin-sensitive aminopeptidase